MSNKTHQSIYILSLFVIVSIFTAAKYETKKSRTFNLFYTPSEHPYIETSLDDFNDRFILDTGGAFYLKINKNLASSIKDKTFDCSYPLININGIMSQETQYQVASKKFMDIKFEKLYFIPFIKDELPTNEIEFNFVTAFSQSIQIKENASCFVGHRLLKHMNIYFDFRNNIFKTYQLGLIPLFKFPYGFFTFTEKIPIQYDYNKGIICTLKTEEGDKKFLLDTGAPVSVLKSDKDNKAQNPSSIKVIKNLMLGNKTYKDFKIAEIQTLPIDGINGILGMDFLFDKVIFINLSENYICIN